MNTAQLNDVFGPNGLGLVTGVGAIVIEDGTRLRALSANCDRAISSAPAGSGVAVILAIEQAGTARLQRWLWVPAQRAAAVKALGRSGSELIGTYGVFPDIAKSTFVFELGAAAERYADRDLLPPSGAGASGALRSLVRSWTRCNVSLGAVVILGRRR